MATVDTSPQPQAQSVVLTRDVATIVRDVWSPSELHSMESRCDVLCPSLPALKVAPSKVYSLRFSLLTAPFETLHNKWKPKGAADADAVGEPLPDAMENATFKVARVTWESRDARLSEGVVAEQCKKAFWFRFTAQLDTRSFVVERAPAHLSAFLAAVQYSFPHLFVPTDPEPSMPLAALVCDFFSTSGSALSSFLPAQYFFFECQEKAAVAFFSALESEIRTRRSHEATLLGSLQPKASKGWFSWGSSKKSKSKGGTTTEPGGDGDALAEMITFMDANAAAIPASVKSAYLVSMSRKNRLARLVDRAKVLQVACEEEAKAVGSVAASVSVSPQTNEPVQSWYGGQEDPLLIEARQSAREMKLTAGLVQQLVFAASTMKAQMGEPVFNALVDMAERAAILAASEEQYLDAYLTMKRSAVENAPYVMGKTPLVKGCAASSSPGLLRQVEELHQSYLGILSTWEQRIDSQIAHAERALRSTERKVCTFVYTAVSSQLEGFDEKHHAQLLSTSSPALSDGAPAPETVSELFQPSQPTRADDILNI